MRHCATNGIFFMSITKKPILLSDPAMTPAELLSENVRHLIETSAYRNVSAFATANSIARTTMHRILSGESVGLNYDVVERIAEAFGIPWWSLYAVDYRETDYKSVDWEHIFQNQAAAMKSKEEIQTAVEKTIGTSIRSIVMVKGITSLSKEDVATIARVSAAEVVNQEVFESAAPDAPKDQTTRKSGS